MPKRTSRRLVAVARRNPVEMFRDSRGVLHPIRGSDDYDDKVARDRAEMRDLFGMTAEEEQRLAATARAEEREQERDREQAERDARVGPLEGQLHQLRAERDELKSYIADHPARGLEELVSDRGRARSEEGLIPLSTARRIIGRRADRIQASRRTRQGRPYVTWDSVLDELASERGYPSGDDLREAIDRLKADEKRLRRLGSEIAETRDQLRQAKHVRTNPSPEPAPSTWLDRLVAWVRGA